MIGGFRAGWYVGWEVVGEGESDDACVLSGNGRQRGTDEQCIERGGEESDVRDEAAVMEEVGQVEEGDGVTL